MIRVTTINGHGICFTGNIEAVVENGVLFIKSTAGKGLLGAFALGGWAHFIVEDQPDATA